MSENKTCCVCGRGYHYCGHCDSNAKQNRWRNNYCSENCRDIFKTVTDYIGQLITIEETKEKLLECNLNVDLNNQISKYTTAILAFEKPKKEIEKPNKETKILKTEENPIEEKPKRRRRKKMEKTEE